MTERELQSGVIDCARLFGWRVAHFRPARVMRGGHETYETPVAADGRGFPDLVMVRGDRVVFAELKGDGGRLRPDQQVWLDAFDRAPGVEAYVWRPEDWLSGDVDRILASGAVVSG